MDTFLDVLAQFQGVLDLVLIGEVPVLCGTRSEESHRDRRN